MTINYKYFSRMLKSIWIGAMVLAISTAGYSQAGMMYPVSLKKRVKSSHLIVEGKVTAKKSYWNTEQSKIFTANRIEVFKVFKGTLQSNNITILTEGGTVGNDKHVIHPSLELGIGEAGVFTVKLTGQTLASYKTNFDNPSAVATGVNQNANEILYRPYASAQGYVKYDKGTKKASGVFDSYTSVTNDLYSNIQSHTHRGFVDVKTFDAKKFMEWARHIF